MSFYFSGLLLAICTFLIIGLFHPLVIKTEYYTGTRFWWGFLVMGLLCVFLSICIKEIIISALLGVLGASFLWAIGELFEQKQRVKKGWFKMNKKRAREYED